MSSKLSTINRSKLRFIFVTRHLNRSGYTALKACLNSGFTPEAVIVSSKRPTLVRKWLRPLELGLYYFKCWFYRCAPLRMIDSEEILARKHYIQVLVVDSLKTEKSKKIISDLALDLIVVAGGWHEKIPLGILECTRRGAINLHPSLLPEFRGTSVTRWQVFEGVNISGVTIHYMDGEFDTGAVIAQRSISVTSKQAPQELFQALADIGAPLLIEVLDSFVNGTRYPLIHRKPNRLYAQYYKKWLWNSTCLILDPDHSLERIHRQVNAATQESYEYPGPALCLNERCFIIRRTELTDRRYRDSELDRDKNLVSMELNALRWERFGENYGLLITQIQPVKPYYYIRRANNPNRWFAGRSMIKVSKVCGCVR